MKKLIYLIVIVLISGLVLTGCLLSNVGQVPTSEQSGINYLTKAGPTEDEAELFPLYAGQDMLVGNVLVWDNGIELCVKYQLSEDALTKGWLLTETHLAVATSLAGIPQTKKGNPIPGKFPYGNDELEGVDSWQKCISFEELGVKCFDPLVIAAHAVIEKCVTVSETITPELTWTRSSELSVAVYPGYGAQWTKEQGFAILTPDAFVWDGGTLGQYFTGYSTRGDIRWASWICTENPFGKSTSGTDLRRFNATFNIPAGYTVTGATLGSVNSGYEDVIPMNDNIYIFMNEKLIFWGGTISLPGLDPTRNEFLGVTRRDTETQNKVAFPETDGWHMAGTFPAIPSGLFIEGANNLDVFAEEFWTGGGMHELGLTLQVEQTTCESETAWAANDEIPEGEEGTLQFEGNNWATYFNYIVCSCENVPEVINGGFESPVVVTTQGWDIYDSGTAGLGWTVEWYDGSNSYGGQNRPEPAHLELHKSGTVVSAYEGVQYAELDTDWDGPTGGLNGEPASVRIYQDLNTCPGVTYNLTYAWHPRNTGSMMKVYWNDVEVASHGGSPVSWTTESILVSQDGYSARLEFVETGTADSLGMFLDDVSVD